MEIHTASKGLRGEIQIPGDKSISHRSVMFGALAKGTTEITHFLQGADCLSTIGCFREMGIEIENTNEKIIVHGKGLHGLSAPCRKQWDYHPSDFRHFVRTGICVHTLRRCFVKQPSYEPDYGASANDGR